MPEYAIAGPTRVCASSGRALAAGEKFYGVLAESAGKVARADYAVECWTGPPAGAIAFWQGRIPQDGAAKKPTFDEAHLGALFAQLAGAVEPERVNLRYAVALLLMRRKKLKFEDLKRTPERDVLILRDAKSGTRHEVTDPRLSDAEIAAVQDQVFAVLQ